MQLLQLLLLRPELRLLFTCLVFAHHMSRCAITVGEQCRWNDYARHYIVWVAAPPAGQVHGSP
jgi:flavorubredoxin